MSRYLSFVLVAALASVPLWLRDFYVLHVLITTGIFIIAAMSLNLLLGFTGQLSLGHVAFFGIGAYTSALVSLGFEIHVLPDVTVGLAPKPVVCQAPRHRGSGSPVICINTARSGARSIS
jgi:branched-chain amino acid transport system permease protein